MPYRYGYERYSLGRGDGKGGYPPGGLVPSFAPDDIASLWMWLRADALALNDGDSVSTWADSHSTAHDATSAGAARPTYKTNIVNSLPVVRFDGTNNYLNLEDMSALTAGEIFVVVKLDNDPPSVGEGGFWLIGSSATSNHIPFTDSTIYDCFGSTVRKTTVNPATSMASWVIYSAYSAANDWANSINGTELFSTATNTVGFSAAPRFGAADNASYKLDGDVAEIVMFSAKLSAGDRTSMIQYLSDKYNLGL